eukprot:gene11647-31989_t
MSYRCIVGSSDRCAIRRSDDPDRQIPEGAFGGQHLPCPVYETKEQCFGDLGCAFSETLLECIDSPCLSLCSEVLCAQGVKDGNGKAHKCEWKEKSDTGNTIKACYHTKHCPYTTTD